VGAGHAHDLYVARSSPVHRIEAHRKLLAAFAFVVVVVATPREWFWAFAGDAVLLAAVAALARLPAGLVLRRMLVEVPFVVFALLLPFIAVGERTELLGIQVSVAGLWGAWNILAKATLGVVCSVLLGATTPVRELLVGLERLRLPTLMVQIMGFMLRYRGVVADELHRMRIARESRGFVARDVRHLPVLARTAGVLFIRCYERGERVHLAMLSRGYTGRMPLADGGTAEPRQWLAALALPAAAAAVAGSAWMLG
jgi:cobalt/nickel transport system permease protein